MARVPLNLTLSDANGRRIAGAVVSVHPYRVGATWLRGTDANPEVVSPPAPVALFDSPNEAITTSVTSAATDSRGELPGARWIDSGNYVVVARSPLPGGGERVQAQHFLVGGSGIGQVGQSLPYDKPGIDAGPALKALIEAGHKSVVVTRPIWISPIAATAAADLRLILEDRCVIRPFGTTHYDNPLLTIYTNHDLAVVGAGHIDGENRASVGALLVNDGLGGYSDLTFGLKTRNNHRLAANPGDCLGGVVRGAFYVRLDGVDSRHIGREAGAGIPGSAGCAGITCTAWGAAGKLLWPQVTIADVYVEGIENDDPPGDSANNDCDGVKVFTGASQISGLPTDTSGMLTVRGLAGKDIAGRLIKTQAAIVDLRNLSLVSETTHPIKFGYSPIGVQSSARGVIDGFDWVIKARSNSRHFNGGYAGSAITLYNGTDQARPQLDMSISNVSVIGDGVPSGQGIRSVVDCSNHIGGGVKPSLCTMTNIQTQGLECQAGVIAPMYASSRQTVLLRDSAFELIAAALFATNRNAPRVELHADNVSQAGPMVPLKKDLANDRLSTAKTIQAERLQGFASNHSASSSVGDRCGSMSISCTIAESLWWSTTIPDNAINGIASNDAVGGFSFANAQDNTGERFVVTFVDYKHPTRVELVQPSGGNRGVNKVQYSDDGVTWLDATSHFTWDQATQVVALAVPKPTKYLAVTGVSGKWAATYLTDIRVYESQPGALTDLTTVNARVDRLEKAGRYREVPASIFDKPDDPSTHRVVDWLYTWSGGAIGQGSSTLRDDVIVGDLFGYVRPIDGVAVQFLWVVSRYSATQVSVVPLHAVAHEELKRISGLLREWMHVDYEPGNTYKFVRASIGNGRYLFEYREGQPRTPHPLNAAAGVCQLASDGDLVPYDAMIVRYLKPGAEVYFADGTKCRLKRLPANQAELSIHPLRDTEQLLWDRTT